MKKLLAAQIFTAILLVFSAGVVFAQENTQSNGGVGTFENRRGQFFQSPNAAAAGKIDNLKEKMASWASDFREKRKEFLKARLSRVLALLSRHIDRMDKILAKIETRLEKIKSGGADVSVYAADLEACKVIKGDLLSKIDSAKVKVNAISDNGDKDGSGQAAVGAVKEIRTGIAHYVKCLSMEVSKIKTGFGKEATDGAK